MNFAHCVLLGAEKRSELFTVLVKNVLGHSSTKKVCKKGPILLKELGEKQSSFYAFFAELYALLNKRNIRSSSEFETNK